MTLKGKVAVVTGGNSGIGKAVVLELARQGANIVIDYVVHPEATEEVEKQIAALGDRSIGVLADVSKVADLEKLIGAAVKAFGRVDIMVNNAGVETRTSVLDTTEAQYDKVMQINLKSAFFGTQFAARQMITRPAQHRQDNSSPAPGAGPWTGLRGSKPVWPCQSAPVARRAASTRSPRIAQPIAGTSFFAPSVRSSVS